MRAEAIKMKGKWMSGVILSLIIFLLLPTGSGAWLSGHHDFQNTNSTTEYGPEPPLGILWKVDRPIIDITELYNIPPLVHGDYVYDAIYNLSAYNRSNGKLLWIAETGQPTDMIYHKGVVYVISGGPTNSLHGVWAVNATTGKIIWQFRRENPENMTLSNNGFIWNNKLVVATLNGFGQNPNSSLPSKFNMTIAFFNLNNGQTTMYKIDTFNWTPPYLMMAYDYGCAYIYSSGYVYGVNLTSFKVLWKVRISTIGYVRAVIIAGHGKIFIPQFIGVDNGKNSANEIMAINAFTGKILWKRVTYYGADFGTMFSYSPLYDEIFTLVRANETKFENVGVTLYNYNLTALNGTTGKVIWAIHDSKWVFGTVSMVPTPDRLYVDSREYMKGNDNSDDFDTTREVERVYNITNGELITVFTVFKRDVPQAYYRYPLISVSDSVIYIPDNSYLIAVGHVSEQGNLNGIYAGTAVGVGLMAVIAGVFVVRKRKAKTHEDSLK